MWILSWLMSELPEDTRRIERLVIWGNWVLEQVRFPNILQKLSNFKTVAYYSISGREEEDIGSEDIIARDIMKDLAIYKANNEQITGSREIGWCLNPSGEDELQVLPSYLSSINYLQARHHIN